METLRVYATIIYARNSERMVISEVNYRSYLQNKTGYPFLDHFVREKRVV